MKKSELIDAIAKSTGVTKADVTRVLNGFVDVVTKSLNKGVKISLIGFLTFEKVKRKATTARNPRTGEEIKVKAKNVAKVKVGKSLNDALN